MNNFKNLKFIDLTHTLTTDTPHWREGCGFAHKIITDYEEHSDATQFRVQSIQMLAGIGTHMDAPIHCIPGAQDIANIIFRTINCSLYYDRYF